MENIQQIYQDVTDEAKEAVRNFATKLVSIQTTGMSRVLNAGGSLSDCNAIFKIIEMVLAKAGEELSSMTK